MSANSTPGKRKDGALNLQWKIQRENLHLLIPPPFNWAQASDRLTQSAGRLTSL